VVLTKSEYYPTLVITHRCREFTTIMPSMEKPYVSQKHVETKLVNIVKSTYQAAI